MLKLTENCLLYFFTEDLYAVLGLSKLAGQKEVKKAYYKVSLTVHPDRVSSELRKNATEKFQILGQVYSILSDKDKRALYDETGSVDDENVLQDRDWSDYWRLIFKKITVEDIEAFKIKYQGSEEERTDIVESYNRFKGNMSKIMNFVPCVEFEDEDRIRKIIQDSIDTEEVVAYKAFTDESVVKKARRRNWYRKEEKEAEEVKKELGIVGEIGSVSGLESIIKKRQEERKEKLDSLIDRLENKYGNKSSKKRKNKDSLENKEKSNNDDSSHNETQARSRSPVKKRKKGGGVKKN